MLRTSGYQEPRNTWALQKVTSRYQADSQIILVVNNFGSVRPKYCLKRQNCSLQFFQNDFEILPKMCRWECSMMVIYFLICFCYRNQEDRPSANMLLQHVYFRLVFIWTPLGFFFIEVFISLVLLKSATYL